MKLWKNFVRSIKQKHSRFPIEYEIILRSRSAFLLQKQNQNDNEKMGEGTWRKLGEKNVLEASMWYAEELLYLQQTVLDIGRDDWPNKIFLVSRHDNMHITHLYKHDEM